MTIRNKTAAVKQAIPAGLFGLLAIALLPAEEIRFKRHAAPADLPVGAGGTGDYGLTALADLDGDGDIDLCSKPWGARPWNGAGGRMHVDFLENLLRSRRAAGQ